MKSLIKWFLLVFLILMITTMMYNSKDFALTSLLIIKDIVFGVVVVIIVGLFLLLKE
jgi:hypothetical protein